MKAFHAIMGICPNMDQYTSEDLRRWLRWNDPNGVWDPSDPDYIELPRSELLAIVQRQIAGE